MIRHAAIALLAFASLTLACCSPASPESMLAQAEGRVAAGDSLAARSILVELSDSAQYALTPSQLCRQALAYARLREYTDNPDDVAAAAACFSKAVELNADSVKAYLDQLGVDDRARLMIISNISLAVEYPGEAPEGQYEREYGYEPDESTPDDDNHNEQ